MIEYKTEDEIKKILSEFDVPELFLVRKIDAGPDENLYLLEDEEKNKFGLWERDYMSELEYEATGLEKDHKVTVKEWVKLKNPTEDEESVFYQDGLYYAVFSE